MCLFLPPSQGTVVKAVLCGHNKRHRAMDQNKQPGNESMHLRATDLQSGCQECAMLNGYAFVLKKSNFLMYKNEIGPLSDRIYKNQLKLD